MTNTEEKVCIECKKEFSKYLAHCPHCKANNINDALDNYQSCEQCHTLYHKDINKCPNCGGGKRTICIINNNKLSTELELENFLLKAQEIFFTNDTLKEIELGSNLENYLLGKLLNSNYDLEYSAFTGLRLCGYEIWSFIDDRGYYYRRPGELEFNKIIK